MADRHPKPPPFAFRIGVVGHRWDKLGRVGVSPGDSSRSAIPELARAERVEAVLTGAVRGVLRSIAQHLLPIAADAANGYLTGTPARLAVVSGLAEGADRIVADVGLEEGYELWAILPFAIDRYAEDFSEKWESPWWSRQAARTDLKRLWDAAVETLIMDGPRDEYLAYEPLGRAVVDHSDLLIAIWDGDPARGAGGTANQVLAARRDDIPILRIDPASPNEPWLEDLGEPREGRNQGLSRVWERLDRLVKPPERAGLVSEDAWNGRLTFFGERHLSGRLGKAYRAMTDHFFARRTLIGACLVPTAITWLKIAPAILRPTLPDDFEAEAASKWAARWGDPLRASPALAHRLITRLAPLYGWLDHLARYYANRHRSAFTVIFSFAWIAAVAAVIGLLAHVFHWQFAWIWGGLELGVIGAIVAMTWWGKRQHFHERWLDYRDLAERIRHLAFLWPLGIAAPGSRLSAKPRPYEDGPHDPGDSRIRWTGWLYRAVVRQLGFGTEAFSEEHRKACRALLRDIEIPIQRQYHQEAAERLEHIHRTVHWRTDWLFIVAGILAALHLAGLPALIAGWAAPGTAVDRERLALTISGWFTVLSVFLPARAAALHGWAGHSELHAGAIRSSQIELRLAELARSVDTLPEISSTTLGAAAEIVARALEGELGSWRAGSLTRPLGWF